jgi:hypothetical protein
MLTWIVGSAGVLALIADPAQIVAPAAMPVIVALVR